MASGKKNYFRHSFHAGNDDKIVNLIASGGKQAYFHYFRMLELCGEQSSESIPESFVFHRRTLCAELMVTNSKLGHHLLTMKSSLLLDYVLGDSKAEIHIPNLSKYLGKYTNKKESNCSNKRKEKKRKENKIYISENYSTDDLIQLWNDEMPSHGFKHCHGLGSGKHLKNFSETTKYIKTLDEWKNILNKCKTNNGLKGENNQGWYMNLNWLVDYDNTLNILNETFQKEKSVLDKWAEKHGVTND